MNRTERQALDALETIITHPHTIVGRLPVARKLVTALNESVHLPMWFKKRSKICEALQAFSVHPLGSGETDPMYLRCRCSDDTPHFLYGREIRCGVCGLIRRKARLNDNEN